MVDASAQMLVSLNQTSCWLCVSAAPPFYEGLALLGNVTYTNSSANLVVDHPALTTPITMGYGTCIKGPKVILPPQVRDICNDTLIASAQFSYVLAPNHMYLACSQASQNTS